MRIAGFILAALVGLTAGFYAKEVGAAAQPVIDKTSVQLTTRRHNAYHGGAKRQRDESTWRALNLNPGPASPMIPAALQINPQDPNILYFRDELRVYKSTDEGKRLQVFGESFDAGAVILLDGEERPSKNDGIRPTTTLIGKSAGKRIRKNPALKIQVRNADGKLTLEITLWPPLN